MSNPPEFGQLGETPDEFERRRLRQPLNEAIVTIAADRARAQVAASAHAAAAPTPIAAPAPLPAASSEENALMVRAVVSELGRELAATFANLREEIEANTRLLGVISAPMEAITDSHERAARSFETLRRDIAEGIDTSPALQQLTQLVDQAGLTQASSRAEARFEALGASIARALTEARAEMRASIESVAESMVQVLHLLERLQARELRDAKRRSRFKLKW
jgi:hypothetical protein